MFAKFSPGGGVLGEGGQLLRWGRTDRDFLIGQHQGAPSSATPEVNTALGHQETPGSGEVLCAAGDSEVALYDLSFPGLPERQPQPNRDKGGPYPSLPRSPSHSSLIARLPDLKTF